MITHVYISIKGKRFSPAEAKRATGLGLNREREPREGEEPGQYEGLTTMHGVATLDAPNGVEPAAKLTWVLDAAIPHVETLRRLGADSMEAWVVQHFEPGGQMNMEFSAEEVAKLARLGLALCVSCYEVEQVGWWSDAGEKRT